METEPIPAKRGRKPKSATSLTEEATDDVKNKPRRGRKPKQVFHCEDSQPVHCQSDDENIVLNLKIKCVKDNESSNENQDEQIDDYIDGYNPENSFIPMPFEINTDEADVNINRNSMESIPSSYTSNSYLGLKVVDLLKDFEEKNKLNEWPTNTSIACYWCCHRFNNTPVGIPVKYSNCKFHVYGCFCSLECAAAYNMTNKDSVDDAWERYNLINMLSRRIGYKNFVKPAPNRLALNMFGGHMSIDEFRSYCVTSKCIHINFPPMMTLTQQVEEINESDLNNDYKYIPIDTERINRYKEKMRLKRTKPVTSFKNTLDHTMNLKYN